MRLNLIYILSLIFLFSCNQQAQENTDQEAATVDTAETENVENEQYIIHTVAFTLRHNSDSDSVSIFLNDARRLLSSIPTVQNFEVRKETSKKNNYEYGFSMRFTDMDAYESYNNHPIHVDFVENRWKKEVEDFLELDYVIIEQGDNINF